MKFTTSLVLALSLLYGCSEKRANRDCSSFAHPDVTLIGGKHTNTRYILQTQSQSFFTSNEIITYYSEDGGVSFEKNIAVPHIQPISASRFLFVDDSIVGQFFDSASNEFKIFRSIDHGKSWALIAVHSIRKNVKIFESNGRIFLITKEYQNTSKTRVLEIFEWQNMNWLKKFHGSYSEDIDILELFQINEKIYFCGNTIRDKINLGVFGTIDAEGTAIIFSGPDDNNYFQLKIDDCKLFKDEVVIVAHDKERIGFEFYKFNLDTPGKTKKINSILTKNVFTSLKGINVGFVRMKKYGNQLLLHIGNTNLDNTFINLNITNNDLSIIPISEDARVPRSLNITSENSPEMLTVKYQNENFEWAFYTSSTNGLFTNKKYYKKSTSVDFGLGCID